MRGDLERLMRERGLAGLVVLADDRYSPAMYYVTGQKITHAVYFRGADGRAQTAKGRKMKAQDFTDPDFQQHKTDAQVVDAIANGTEKDMPPFGKVLSAEQIESLLQDVRGFGR